VPFNVVAAAVAPISDANPGNVARRLEHFVRRATRRRLEDNALPPIELG